MARTFEYAVLMAIPDRRRGERVNVGIMILLDDRIDIRLPAASKIGAIAGGNWSAYARDLQRRLAIEYKTGGEAARAISVVPQVDPIIEASDLAPLVLESASDYEDTVTEILDTLVIKPKAAHVRSKATRINAEISREFRHEGMLATADQPIESRKVVRNFPIENELKADFALRNGSMHVAATLDLRRTAVNIKEAALKAIVLDRAKEHFGSDTMSIGIYATSEDAMGQFKTHVELLTEYSDKCFNWSDEGQRQEFQAVFHDAFGLKRLGRFF